MLTTRPRRPGAAHREQTEPDPALDGPERRPRLDRDLLLRQPAEVGELDRLPLDVGQAAQRDGDLLAVEVAGHFLPDVGQGQARGGTSSRSGSSTVGPATADGVDGPVVDDREQPRLDAALALDVARGVSPGAEKGVLDDVLGKRGVGGDPEGDRVGHRSVGVVQVLQGVKLTVGDAEQHGSIGIVGWRCHAPRDPVRPVVHGCMRSAC